MKSTLTDAQLRKLALHVADPYAQPGLVRDIPEGIELVEVINTYSYARYPDEKAYCAHCKRSLHRDGFTAQLTDHSYVLLGSHCGADLFGQNWQKATQGLATRKSRQRSLARLDFLAPRFSPMLQALHANKRDFVQLDETKLSFAASLPDVYKGLKNVSDDGKLVLQQRVRDLVAEQESTDDMPIYKLVDGWTHYVKGFEFLSNYGGQMIHGRAEAAIRDLWGLAVKSTDRLSVHEIDKQLKRFDDAIEDLRRVQRMCRAANDFFEWENLRMVAHWATHTSAVRGRYKATAGGTLMTEDGERAFMFDAIPVPNLSAFNFDINAQAA